MAGQFSPADCKPSSTSIPCHSTRNDCAKFGRLAGNPTVSHMRQNQDVQLQRFVDSVLSLRVF